MLKLIQKIMGLLVKDEEHTHEAVVDEEKIQLKKDLVIARKNEKDAAHQADLWRRKSAQLQDKLSTAQGEITVLEEAVAEATRKVEALELALELREVEEVEGLQTYIDDLEKEIDEAIELITKYGLQLRKM